MCYILMNKQTPLCKLQIDTMDNFIIEDVLEVYDTAAFPIGVDIVAGKPQKKSLAKWWAGRAVPGSRVGGSSFEARYNVKLAALPFKNYGLSLSDQYWIKPCDADIKWENVNFFTNEFSLDVGNALFDSSYQSAQLDFMSPDNTSDGMLPKRWVRDELTGKTVLLKAGSGPLEQEPFNEHIATKIFERLNAVPYVDYKIVRDGDKFLSSCENFITTDTELVTAASMMLTLSPVTTKHSNKYDFLLKCCEQFDIPMVQETLDVMLAVDYLICNSDRHYGNFGFIRDVNTLQFKGVAPIYDNGTSLWNKDAQVGKNFEAKAFANSHDENIKLITNWDLIDLSNLKDIDELVESILIFDDYLSPKRIGDVAKAAKEQWKKLEKMKRGMKNG